MTAAKEAPIHARMGAPRSGKTASTKIDVKAANPGRLLIWDPKREFEDMAQVVRDLPQLYHATNGKSFKLRYVPGGGLAEWKEKFSAFCLIALERQHLTMIVDELADVTLPGWAPEGWQMATRQSAHHHLTIYGLSQTPAGVDKTFFNNASHVRTGRLGSASNIRTMADALMCTQHDIRALSGTEFIEYERVTQVHTKGDVFPKDRPAPGRATRGRKGGAK